MAFYKQSELISISERQTQPLRKSAEQIFKDDSRAFTTTKTYDIFLSHSHEDARAIHGVKWVLEQGGVSVYVDWLDDTVADRSKVSSETAAVLRVRMGSCRSLVYASSKNASQSKWMPWELGFFDGLREGQIAIFPILGEYDSTWNGQEYLGLYPVIERLPTQSGGSGLYVTHGTDYLGLREFGAGNQAFKARVK